MLQSSGHLAKEHPLKIMNLIKTISIQTIVLLVTFEFFSFVLTNFNLLIFNEKPIYFKKNYDGEIWRSSNLEIGPWHNISVSTRHVKTCFDVSYSSNNIGARDNKNYFPKTFEKSIVLIGESFAEVRIKVVPVDEHGLVDPEQVARRVDKDTVLVSVMYVNNEVGTIQNIARISELVKKLSE